MMRRVDLSIQIVGIRNGLVKGGRLCGCAQALVNPPRNGEVSTDIIASDVVVGRWWSVVERHAERVGQ
jgi:hypothetical protein